MSRMLHKNKYNYNVRFFFSPSRNVKVEFSADTLRLNLIDLARTGSKLIQVAGRIDYTCPIGDPQDPVTFTTRDSHLVNNYSVCKRTKNIHFINFL